MQTTDIVNICKNIESIIDIVYEVDPSFYIYYSTIKTSINLNPRRMVETLYTECSTIRDRNDVGIGLEKYTKLVIDNMLKRFAIGRSFDMSVYTNMDMENKHLIQIKVKDILTAMKLIN